MRASAHAAFKLQFHLVIVTKYRHKVLTEAMLAQAQHIFGEVLGRRAYYLGSAGDGEALHRGAGRRLTRHLRRRRCLGACGAC